MLERWIAFNNELRQLVSGVHVEQIVFVLPYVYRSNRGGLTYPSLISTREGRMIREELGTGGVTVHVSWCSTGALIVCSWVNIQNTSYNSELELSVPNSFLCDMCSNQCRSICFKCLLRRFSCSWVDYFIPSYGIKLGRDAYTGQRGRSCVFQF